MNISLDCDAGLLIAASKDINKIVEWCQDHYDKYFNVINKLDGNVLVNNSNTSFVPAWCSFESIKVAGDVTNLKLVATDESIKTKLYKLTKKLKKFDCDIQSFDNNPLGFHPYFVFTKGKHKIHVVIEKNNLDIHVGLV